MKIYIVSTGNMVTGGPETLHQTASIYKKAGYDVKMYYIDPHVTDVPERFKKYQVDVADSIEDNDENILIVPETLTYILKNMKNIKACIWWLSLDNYFRMIPSKMTKWRMEEHHVPGVLFPAVFLTFLLKRKFHFGYYKFNDHNTYFHAYNCEYAREFITSNGVSDNKIIYLCGPLNESFFKAVSEVRSTERENIVLYNPKKGLPFTKKIIAEAQKQNINAEFIPIINMTPAQIIELMAKAKVYMDFGYFPGPERIPREAVTLGCNIITSKNGSAANDVDVPIPSEMKFADNDDNIIPIVGKIKDMLADYEKYYSYYDVYRNKVRDQVQLLEENTMKLLEMMEGTEH